MVSPAPPGHPHLLDPHYFVVCEAIDEHFLMGKIPDTHISHAVPILKPSRLMEHGWPELPGGQNFHYAV